MLPKNIVPLITPFSGNGQVDFEGLKQLIAWHIESGSEGILLCGTTGEGNLLSLDEKLRVFEIAIETAKGKIKVLANTGTLSTKESVDLTQTAKKMGMDGIMAIIPFYLCPSFEGCLAHFAALDACEIPIILYYHPKRTGVTLTKEELLEFSKFNNVNAIKDSSGDHQIIKHLTDHEVLVYCANDEDLLDYFALGAEGSMSMNANIVPKLWQELINTKSGQLFSTLRPLISAVGLEPNPQCVKYGVSLVQGIHPSLRLPLIDPSEASKHEVRLALETIGVDIFCGDAL